jgi:ketosteroid isomerase-like protein
MPDSNAFKVQQASNHMNSIAHTFLILLLLFFSNACRTSNTLAQSTAPPDAKPKPANIEQSLRGLSDQWARVGVTLDVAVLRRIFAADFVYVEPSGQVFNKDEFIALVSKSTEKITSAEISNFKVRVYGAGSVAVTVGDFREVGRDKDGKSFDSKSRFTNVWVLRNGSWQCVSGHSSDLPSN